MGYYPIIVDIADKKCLVVGGGKVALRKVQALHESGARVTVVAPEICPEIEQIEGVHIEKREFTEHDIDCCTLVFAATNDRNVNARVSQEAKARAIQVNVVDDPELCSFIVPAIVRRSDLLIAISTCGKAPAYAKKLRKDLENEFGPEYGLLVELINEFRYRIMEAGSHSERSRIVECIACPEIIELLKRGQMEEARKRASECI